jgi:homospermidine synthase
VTQGANPGLASMFVKLALLEMAADCGLRQHEPRTAVEWADLGEVVGVYGDWTPLHGRNRLFPEDLDEDDPWQFRNFRVT